jgi:hypothetical protein
MIVVRLAKDIGLKYVELLKTKPYITKMLTAATTTSTSDFIV